MGQQRICEYLGLKCTHPLSILSLPAHLRRQIYIKADTISDSDVDLGRYSGTDSWAFATHSGATYSLLLTNHAIYAEVSTLIYSTNCFFIHYRTQRSLKRLRSLSLTALASLRHLTIDLTAISCKAGHPCCNAYPGRSRFCDEHDRALGVSTKRDQTILSEWTLPAAYTFRHIRSPTLHFHFVCDVSTLEIGHRVLAPSSTAPLLASCAIRLARKPDPILQKLARGTALRAMGRDHQVIPTNHAEPFRFLALPTELRKHIRYFTDLVSPHSEIQYSPTRAYHLHYCNWCCAGSSRIDCPTSIHQACALRNCWQRAEENIGCFCSAAHAAFWTECLCWRLPTALFFVSKAVSEDARGVFLGANRFVIVPECGSSRKVTRDVVDRTPERMHAAPFLTQVVPLAALCHLRILEVVFPPFRTPWILAHEPTYRQ